MWRCECNHAAVDHLLQLQRGNRNLLLHLLLQAGKQEAVVLRRLGGGRRSVQQRPDLLIHVCTADHGLLHHKIVNLLLQLLGREAGGHRW